MKVARAQIGTGKPVPSAEAQGIQTVTEATKGSSGQIPGQPITLDPDEIKVSFFFDGTGNNYDADYPTLEHSNVARLWQAHKRPAGKVYRFYVPGIGTYFKDIGDDGGLFGMGFGAWGWARLQWAQKQLQDVVKRHHTRTLAIAIFGFSRGAALARAFALWIAGQTVSKDGKYYYGYKGSEVRVRIYFMGLFDTVASVGLPSSTLTTIDYVWNQAQMLPNSKLERLAAGPGPADPTAGLTDGHLMWASDLSIPPLVEECVHMTSAHENRNSFPLDSVYTTKGWPTGCREMFYPGVHSDVGGGYRAGESARSVKPQLQLSTIPLRAMYYAALAAGVPLRARSKMGVEFLKDFGWDAGATRDSARLLDLFKYYMDKAGWGEVDMGPLMLSHTKVYYQWRFHRIFRNGRLRNVGRPSEDEAILRPIEQQWQNEKVQLMRKAAELKDKYLARRGKYDGKERDEYRKVMAQIETSPKSDGSYLPRSKALDDQLVRDAKTLESLVAKSALRRLRLKLRPHYQAILDAYLAEKSGRGLKDPKIIEFFETYVHDSLAGFDTDTTSPSDPRVIYIGGDTKLGYA